MVTDWEALPGILEEYDRRASAAEDELSSQIAARIDERRARLERAFIAAYTSLLANKNLAPAYKRAILMAELRDQSLLIDAALEGYYFKLFEEFISTQTQAGDRLAQQALGDKARGGSILPTVAIAALAAEAVRRLYSHNARFQSRLSALAEINFSLGKGARAGISGLRLASGELKTRADTLTLTESSGAFMGGAMAAYGAAGVPLLVFHTQGDDRVCSYCSPRTGKVYRMGEIFTPLHGRCRCFLWPLFESELKDPAFQTWAAAASEGAMVELTAAGKRAASTAAPFERAADGDRRPPSPIWKPG